MRSLKRRLWKITAGTLAGVVILLAIGVGLFRAAVPFVPALSSEAEQRVEEAFGWPLQIGSMDLRWQFIGPMLVLEDVALLSPQTGTPVIRVKRIDLIFRPGDVLQDSDYRPAHIRLHEPQLAVERDLEGEIWLSGHRLSVDPDARLDWRTLLRRSLKHGRFSIIDGTLVYRDRKLGIQDWALRNFNLTVASDGESHEFTGSFLPPGPLGEQAAFSITAEGDPSLPEQWEWEAELGARQVRINWLYEQVQWAGPGSFIGTMNISAKLSGTGIDALRGQGDFAADSFGYRPAGAGMSAGESRRVDRLSFDWILEIDEPGVAVDLENLDIRRGEEPWPESTVRLVASTRDPRLDLRASFLRLEDLSPILQWLPSDLVSDDIDIAIGGLQPRGEVHDLALAVSESEGIEEVSFTGEGLGIDAWRDIPGISGLELDVAGYPGGGEINLATRSAELDLGTLFRNRIPVERMAGTVGWQRNTAGIAVAVSKLDIANSDAGVTASGSIFLPGDGPVQTALQGTVTNANVAATPRYLPVAVMSDELAEWLDRATPKGRIPHADWVLEGALSEFPWKDGSGRFDIRFPINDLTLVYDQDWPRVEAADVDVHFAQESLTVMARSGRTAGLSIAGVKAAFGDLTEGDLSVNGPVRGDVSQGFAFLAASPLQERLAGILEQVSPRGAFDATVALDLPLKDIDTGTVDVRATLDDIAVDVAGLPWPVQSLQGELHVTRDLIESGELQGQLTGHPFRASISSEASEDGIGPVAIDMAGTTDAASVGEYLPPGWASRLDGRFAWEGVLRANSDDEPLTIELRSSLEEIASAMPAPLDRLPQSEALIAFPEQGQVDVHIGLDGLLAARLGFQRDEENGSLRLRRGAVVAGEEPEVPELPLRDGMVVTGSVDVLPALDWVLLGDDVPDREPANGPGVRAVDIHATEFQLGRLSFADQRLAGERVQDTWVFSLQGPIHGAVRLPSEFSASSEATLNLEQLLIADDGEEESDAARPDDAPDPRELPSATLDIRDLRIGDLDFGHVTGRLRRTSIGYVTEDLAAGGSAWRVTVNGRWEYVDSAHYTSMNGQLNSTDLESTLAQLGYRGGLGADDATIDFNLAWPASPAGWDIGILEGKVGFRFEDGQLREVSPGAGRMLGILSLSALPRRLLLDFSDLFGEGLAFDELTGDYLITNGNAYTTNVKLDGASITAWLVGRTGLKQRDYDQVAIVDPGVGASIPVAGYLAAGPTVGAALLLASQILKTPLSDITQVKYRITGSWEDPVIEEVESPPPENEDD